MALGVLNHLVLSPSGGKVFSLLDLIGNCKNKLSVEYVDPVKLFDLILYYQV